MIPAVRVAVPLAHNRHHRHASVAAKPGGEPAVRFVPAW